MGDGGQVAEERQTRKDLTRTHQTEYNRAMTKELLPPNALRALLSAVKVEAELLGTASVRLARCPRHSRSSFELGVRFARRLIVEDITERIPELRPIIAREIRNGRNKARVSP